MSRLAGAVLLSRLPEHCGLMVNLTLYPVASADALPPYDGDPPANAPAVRFEICKDMDLDKVSNEAAREIPFEVDAPNGFHYLEVRTILMRPMKKEFFAQVEPFFFKKRPLHIREPMQGSLTLPLVWPDIPLEDLHRYAEVKPK